MSRLSRGTNPGVVCAALLLPLALSCVGCSGRSSDLADRVRRAARLEGAKQSPLAELAQKTQAIIDAGTGPAGLTIPPGDPQSNAAAALNSALTDADRLKLIPQLEELSTPHAEGYSKAQAQAIERLVKLQQPLIQALEEATGLPRCASGVSLEQGFFDRYAFLDDATIAVRMHMVLAAAELNSGNVSRAIEQATKAARWVQWLAGERRLEGRLLAANLRHEWLQLVQAITSTSATPDQLQLLLSELRSQLNNWPHDRDSLVGDRAVTMHAYEALRLGLIERVLTTDEKEKLKGVLLLETVRSMDGPAIDQDELVYLQAIQQIIDTSDQPYYQRFEELLPILDQLKLGQDAATGTPLATWLFLPGIPDALELMARDRALTEGWALAIASAAEFDMPPYRVNPMTGNPYEASRDAEGVRLRLKDPQAEDPFVNTGGIISGR